MEQQYTSLSGREPTEGCQIKEFVYGESTGTHSLHARLGTRALFARPPPVGGRHKNVRRTAHLLSAPKPLIEAPSYERFELSIFLNIT